MTLLLYILLFSFLAIETPLISLMVYLLRHTTTDPKVSRMRQIIFVIAFAKSLFISAQIILVFDSLVQAPQAIDFVIWSYTLSTIILAVVDWWALFTLKNLA